MEKITWLYQCDFYLAQREAVRQNPIGGIPDRYPKSRVLQKFLRKGRENLLIAPFLNSRR